MVMNKKGWTRIVEVFMAITLIAALTMVLIDNSELQERNFSEKIYEEQSFIMQKIQLNDSLREDVLEGELDKVNKFVKKETPNYLNCSVCLECLNVFSGVENVYVKRILITNDLNSYDPKELKLYCKEI